MLHREHLCLNTGYICKEHMADLTNPKQLTIHLKAVHQTHDLGIASTMLDYLCYGKTLITATLAKLNTCELLFNSVILTSVCVECTVTILSFDGS